MAKKVKAVVRLQLQAGKAFPGPPVGPSLAPYGIDLMGFVKAYNERTAAQAGTVIPAEITIFEDRSFTFITKTPPASELLKKAAGLKKGSGVPNRDIVGTVKRDQVREIAEMKMPDLNANDIDAAIKIVAGTARSMGIRVSE